MIIFIIFEYECKEICHTFLKLNKLFSFLLLPTKNIVVCPTYATGQYDFCLRALGRKFPMSTSLKMRFAQFLAFRRNFLFTLCTFSVDTIVAMEALVRYSYNSRIKDITDLNVEVDIPDSNITMNYYIDGKVSQSSSCFFVCCHLCYCLILQGSKKNNNMRISQLRKVIPSHSYINSFITLHRPLNSTNRFF